MITICVRFNTIINQTKFSAPNNIALLVFPGRLSHLKSITIFLSLSSTSALALNLNSQSVPYLSFKYLSSSQKGLHDLPYIFYVKDFICLLLKIKQRFCASWIYSCYLNHVQIPIAFLLIVLLCAAFYLLSLVKLQFRKRLARTITLLF